MRRAMRCSQGIGLVAAVALATCAWAAGTYKWVDEKGNVHYSDQPPDTSPKGATVLDKQGRAVKRIEPPLTPEQLKAKADEEERQRVLVREKEDQARKDRALMQSYTNESEIDIARGRAVSTIESQIKSAQAYTAELTRRQQESNKQKQSYSGKPVPIALERELNTINDELSRQAILIRQKQEELKLVTTKYDTIKQRWREILADQERAAAADAEAAAARGGKGTPGKPATSAPTAATK